MTWKLQPSSLSTSLTSRRTRPRRFLLLELLAFQGQREVLSARQRLGVSAIAMATLALCHKSGQQEQKESDEQQKLRGKPDLILFSGKMVSLSTLLTTLLAMEEAGTVYNPHLTVHQLCHRLDVINGIDAANCDALLRYLTRTKLLHKSKQRGRERKGTRSEALGLRSQHAQVSRPSSIRTK